MVIISLVENQIPQFKKKQNENTHKINLDIYAMIISNSF